MKCLKRMSDPGKGGINKFRRFLNCLSSNSFNYSLHLNHKQGRSAELFFRTRGPPRKAANHPQKERDAPIAFCFTHT